MIKFFTEKKLTIKKCQDNAFAGQVIDNDEEFSESDDSRQLDKQDKRDKKEKRGTG